MKFITLLGSAVLFLTGAVSAGQNFGFIGVEQAETQTVTATTTTTVISRNGVTTTVSPTPSPSVYHSTSGTLSLITFPKSEVLAVGDSSSLTTLTADSTVLPSVISVTTITASMTTSASGSGNKTGGSTAGSPALPTLGTGIEVLAVWMVVMIVMF